MEQEIQNTKALDEKYCSECGATIKAKAEICPVEPGPPEDETLPNNSDTTGDSAPICPKCEGKMILRNTTVRLIIE